MAASRKKEKSIVPIIVVLVVVAVLLLIAVLTNNRPSNARVDLNGYFASENGNIAVVRDNVLTHEDFWCTDGRIYISVTYLQEKLNKRFYFDQTESILLYTLPTGTVEADLSTKWEDGPVLIRRNETVYVIIDYVKQYTAMTWQYYETPERIVLRTVFGDSGVVRTLKEATVRSGASVTKPIMTVLPPGTAVHYLEEQAEWDLICTEDGIEGYISKNDLSDPELVNTPSPYKEPEYTTPEPEHNICMVWQQVRYKSENDDLEELLSQSKGVTVVSPTWLFLKDGEGNFDSSADVSYVERAHAMGLKVWILLNNMDNEIYGETLHRNFNVSSNRRKLIQGIMQVLRDTGADGINVDIESLSSAGAPGFLQFIRELSVACHRGGYILSVDNYVPSPWTNYYDRKEQAVFADYIVVMAYDEHYAGAEAGSTASMEFVLSGIEATIAQVPAYKVICGVPFFTRLWIGTGSAPSSISLGMNEIPAYISKYNVTPSWEISLGQYYAEFEIDGEQARIWIEDKESMTLRLDNLTSYGLAGIAAWRLGMETADVWNAFAQFFENNQIQ